MARYPVPRGRLDLDHGAAFAGASWYQPRAAGGVAELTLDTWRKAIRGRMVAPALREHDTPWDLVRGLVDIGRLKPNVVITSMSFWPDHSLIDFLEFPAPTHG